MQQLLELGKDQAEKDPEFARRAYVALLRRFAITSSKSIEDEEEKGWVYRELNAVGKPLLPALASFSRDNENIAWSLRLVEDIANEAEEWQILEELLERHPPDSFERAADKKLQLLTHVKEIDDPRVIDILARYLGDRDESVRFFAVEAIIEIDEADSVGWSVLVDRLCHGDEDSLRLRTRILDGLSAAKHDISGDIDRITPHLGAEHAVTDGKIVRR